MSDWKKTTVGMVSTGFLSGGTPTTSRADYWQGEIPWITSKWLGDKLELTSGEKLVSKEAIKHSATKIVPKDSIIFATRVGVGKVGINRINLAINQDLAGILIDNENYDIKFLAYQLGLDSIQQYVAMNKRGATIKGITRDCLEQIRLNIPSLPEQKKIAHILSTVQRAIKAQERIIQTTTELKKAIMHKLFTEGLRNELQKQTEIGLVPKSWDVVGLGTLLREPLRNGHSAKATNNEDGIRTLTLTAVTQRNFSIQNTKVTCADSHRVRDMWLMSGDIFIERANTADYVGLAALYEGEEDFAIFPDLLIRVRVDTSRILPNVLIEWLLAEPCRRYFKKNARSTAGNFPKIDQGTVEKTFIPLPSAEEQTEMVVNFRTLDNKLRQHTERKDALQDLFRTLLHELMTAKTRVHDIKLGKEVVS